ncbi:MAG: aromatic amino acid lyase, partial [Deltaproteobacteria bacterium]|nr:aromatic amino acid lyase [Deltaproteobacteria bacterium]
MLFLEVGSLKLTPGEFLKAFHENRPLRIDEEARKRIIRSRQIVDSCTVPTYAINTGIGSLKDKRISHEDLSRLSHNILKSHACGLGRPLPSEVSQLMLLLRIHTLALGFSGVRLELIEKLMELHEKRVFGVVYEHGSVGSSGDLVPLA